MSRAAPAPRKSARKYKKVQGENLALIMPCVERDARRGPKQREKNMVEDLDYLTRDIVTRGELNEKGLRRAEYIARTLKPRTARRLAILYAKVAELADPAPAPRRANRKALAKGGKA